MAEQQRLISTITNNNKKKRLHGHGYVFNTGVAYGAVIANLLHPSKKRKLSPLAYQPAKLLPLF